MTSSTDIVNRALQAIGTRSTIASLAEGSNEANNASLVYASVRQQMIRAAPWNFCTATAVMTLLKEAPGTPEAVQFSSDFTSDFFTGSNGYASWSTVYPPPGWRYEYAYPADCLRARRVIPGALGSAGSAVSMFPSGLAAARTLWDAPAVRFQVTTDLDVSNNPFTCILTNAQQAILVYLRDITIEDLWDPLFTEAMVKALAGRLALALTSDKATAELMFKLADDAIMTARAADGNEGVTVLEHDPDWITQAFGMGAYGLAGRGGASGGFALPYGSLFSGG